MVPTSPSHAPDDTFDSDDLSAVAKNAWDAIVVIDIDGVVRFWNDAAEQLFGYTEPEALGEPVHDLLAPPAYAAAIEHGFEQFVETNEGAVLDEVLELEAEHKSGEKVPVELTVTAYERDGDRYAIAIIRDITDRRALQRELERERDRAERYFESAGTLMVVIDTEGDIERINQRGRALLGYEQGDLIGENWFETVLPADVTADVSDLFDGILGNKSDIEVHENEVLTATGERRTIKWHNTAVRDDAGEVQGVLSSGSDVTERREKERELQRQNERLDEFAGVVSHDLRNPLNVAQGRAKLVDTACESDHVEPLLEGLARIGAIIEETLTLARQGKTVGETEAVTLSALVRDSWEMVETAAGSLDVVDDGAFQADPDRLNQLFENLFRNAVEHGATSNQPEPGDAVEHGSTSNQPEPGDAVERKPADITVTVGCLDDGFYVADDGSGIPPAARDNVFEAGYSSTPEGTGFGLSIVREIAQAHGWDVAVTESATGGARFEVTGVIMS